jgi:cbb3-type cytochrome oxidase cytochrome c subunit
LRITLVLALGLALLLAAGSWGWGQAPEPKGRNLAERLGCFACHAANGKGGNLAAPLDGVGARLTPPQLQIALTYPRQLHPQAKMPSYAYLPGMEQAVLVKYLESLK